MKRELFLIGSVIDSGLVMTLLVEFEGVEEILPDAVKSSGNGGHRGHPGIPEPDQEAGILLTQGLPCRDRIAADAPPCPSPELELDEGAE